MPDQILRALTQGAYDLQKVRISVGNRLCQSWYQSHGVKPGEKPEDQLEEHDKKLLDAIRLDYRRLTDGLVRLPRAAKFEATPYISSYAILRMVLAYEQTLKAEETAMAAISDQVESTAIWTHFLAGVRGCGPTMAAVLLSRLDIELAKNPSQFWKFAGYAVMEDGRGQSRRKEHLVDREYLNKNGEIATKKSIQNDPWLKTKLYVLATCFLKAGGHYKEIYDGYKARLKAMPPIAEQVPSEGRPLISTVDWAATTDGHRHAAAMRYMIKMFLQDLWREWRTLDGLPVVDPYPQGKLGLPPHRAAA